MLLSTFCVGEVITNLEKENYLDAKAIFSKQKKIKMYFFYPFFSFRMLQWFVFLCRICQNTRIRLLDSVHIH